MKLRRAKCHHGRSPVYYTIDELTPKEVYMIINGLNLRDESFSFYNSLKTKFDKFTKGTKLNHIEKFLVLTGEPWQAVKYVRERAGLTYPESKDLVHKFVIEVRKIFPEFSISDNIKLETINSLTIDKLRKLGTHLQLDFKPRRKRYLFRKIKSNWITLELRYTCHSI